MTLRLPKYIGAPGRWLLAFALILCFPLPLLSQAAHAPQTREVRLGVFVLFHPDVLTVAAADGQDLHLSTAEVVHGPLRLQVEGERIRCGSQDVSVCAVEEEPGSRSDLVLAIPGKINRHFRGTLEVRVSNRRLLPVVRMDLETAVASVVAAESLSGTPMEALKAQAVAARSYFAAGSRHGEEFDFCDTTHCQFLREPPAPGTPAFAAAEQTRGVVLAFNDRVFAAMYSKSCGGQTHSLVELGMRVHDYPYYAVVCQYCRRHPETWVARISSDSEKDLASRHTEQARLQLARTLGWSTVSGNSYTIHKDDKDFVLAGAGVGHGLGLCQRGAAAMARAGSSFQEILLHYYPNTTLQQLR